MNKEDYKRMKASIIKEANESLSKKLKMLDDLFQDVRDKEHKERIKRGTLAEKVLEAIPYDRWVTVEMMMTLEPRFKRGSIQPILNNIVNGGYAVTDGKKKNIRYKRLKVEE